MSRTETSGSSDIAEMLVTRLCMTMLAEAFKLPYGQEILARLLRYAARDVARHALEFEGLAGRYGNLKAPSRYLVDVMSRRTNVRGVEQIPQDGPVLITCNHPGVFDAMVVLASLPRTDVKVLARSRNLLQALPNVRRHIIPVQDDAPGRMTALRDALRHLAADRLLVTFPRGSIEPDPLLHAQAATASLAGWSSSANVLAKHVPGLAVVPAAIGGIISLRARASWLARRHHSEVDRDWMAATLQFMLSNYRDIHPTLVYGSPIYDGNVLEQVRTASGELYRTLARAHASSAEKVVPS